MTTRLSEVVGRARFGVPRKADISMTAAMTITATTTTIISVVEAALEEDAAAEGGRGVVSSGHAKSAPVLLNAPAGKDPIVHVPHTRSAMVVQGMPPIPVTPCPLGHVVVQGWQVRDVPSLNEVPFVQGVVHEKSVVGVQAVV
jgi:hypothetical protein